jgi:CBS domain-containing protein
MLEGVMKMRVRELMSRPAVSCGPDDSLESAAGLMWDHDCGSLPVMEDARVVGVITDRDICMAAYNERRLLSDIPVSRAMATTVAYCSPGDSIESAEAMFAEHQVRRLPVLDEDGVLVGVLSLDDLVRRARNGRSVSPKQVASTYAAIIESRVNELPETD